MKENRRRQEQKDRTEFTSVLTVVLGVRRWPPRDSPCNAS